MTYPTMTDLVEAVSTALPVASVRGLTDENLLGTIRDVETLGRLIDALRVAAAGELAARSRTEIGAAGLAARKGCRNANELLQRLTSVSGVTGAARLSLAALTRPDVTISGTAIPAAFERVRAALDAGNLGIDAAIALTKNLAPLGERVHPEALD